MKTVEDFKALSNKLYSFHIVSDQLKKEEKNYFKTAFLNLISKDPFLPQLEAIASSVLDGELRDLRGSLQDNHPHLVVIFFKVLSSKCEKTYSSSPIWIFEEIFPHSFFTALESYSEEELTCAVTLLNRDYSNKYNLDLEFAKKYPENLIRLCNHPKATFSIRFDANEEKDWSNWFKNMLDKCETKDLLKIVKVAARLQLPSDSSYLTEAVLNLTHEELTDLSKIFNTGFLYFKKLKLPFLSITVELAKKYPKNLINLCNHKEIEFTIKIDLENEKNWANWLQEMLLDYKMEEHSKIVKLSSCLEVAFDDETLPSKALAIALLNLYDQGICLTTTTYFEMGKWPSLFESDNAISLLINIQKALMQGPNGRQLNDSNEITKIREEAANLLSKISNDISLLTPSMKLEYCDLIQYRGLCTGCSLQMAKELLQNWDDFENTISSIGSKYSKNATVEGYVTQVAYGALIYLQSTTIKLFQAAYHLLDDPEDRASALFYFIVDNEIDKEKGLDFLKREENDPKVLQYFIELYENDEKKITTESIDAINIYFLANHIVRGGSLEDSLTIEQNKKIAKLFKQKKKISSNQIKAEKPLHDVLGIVLKPFPIISKNDVETLEMWIKNADDGVYGLTCSMEKYYHAILFAKKNGIVCYIDPNSPVSENGKPFIVENEKFSIHFYDFVKKGYTAGYFGYSFKFDKIELK